MTERRTSGFYMKTWHVALLTIILLATIASSILYGQKIGKDTNEEVEKLIPKVNYLEKCVEVEKEKQEGRHNLLMEKIDTSNDKIDNLNKKFDKMIDLMNSKLDSAIIFTSPTPNNN